MSIPLTALFQYIKMMWKFRSKVNFSQKLIHRYVTLVYIIFLLGYDAPSHHVSAADAEDGDVRSPKEAADTFLPCSKRRTSKDSEEELATIKTEKNAGLGRARRSAEGPRFVVFGTEGTICCEQSLYEIKLRRSYLTNHSECPHWQQSHSGEKSMTIFLPHLRILFDYLLGKGVRIVFVLSHYDMSGRAIPKLLESFWGREKYKELKSQGQFHIHTSSNKVNDYYDPNRHHLEDVRYFKNMESIRRDGESLLNSILVDGYTEECHPDQQPCIPVRAFYPGTDLDSSRLNSVYYMLGVFKTYFENEKYQKLPMRTAFKEILPVDFGLDESLPQRLQGYLRWEEDHPFVREMTNVGLSAVREEVSNATLYKSSGLLWRRNV